MKPGILDTLIGGLGGASLQRTSTPQSQPAFPSFLLVTHGDAAYNTAAEVYGAIAAVGIESIIWEKTVPAQQELAWGYGRADRPANQGYMWFAMLDSGTDWSVGTLRLAQSNARRTKIIVVAEMADSDLHSTTVTTIATAALLNKEEKIALPEQVQYPKVGEDSLIQLRYILITAATTADAAGFSIPISVYQ